MEAQPQAGYSVEAAYPAYHDRLLRYIQTRVNNEWDAENLAQDIWVRVLTSERALQADTLLPYLYTIARNLINDYLRRLYAAKALHDEMAYDFYDDAADESMESSIYAGEIADAGRVPAPDAAHYIYNEQIRRYVCGRHQQRAEPVGAHRRKPPAPRAQGCAHIPEQHRLMTIIL